MLHAPSWDPRTCPRVALQLHRYPAAPPTSCLQSPNAPMASPPALTAIYKSPLSPTPHTFSRPLPLASASSTSTDAKSQHLANLRAAVISLQEEVNTYLTERMEVEKKAEEDAAAEEKYGEEEGDEDEG